MKKLSLMVSILALSFLPHRVYAQNDNRDELQEMARQAAWRYGVDVSLVFAIINQESRWHPKIVSPKGAIGLMQIMPSTGNGECGLTKKQLYDPYNNLDCGVRYFKQQLDRFGSVKLALCAYNAGPHRVAKRGNQCPTFKETAHYVHNIMTDWGGEKPSYEVPQRVTPVTPTPIPVYKIPKRKQPQYIDAEKLYCKYFPDMCQQGGAKLKPSYRMESMPKKQPIQSQSSFQSEMTAMDLYCQTFPDMCP